jgi:uncharacterized membrane protein SpoIIM required for sporulation
MIVNDFIRSREKDWGRLEGLLKTHAGRRPLDAAEVRELGVLYRAVMSDLALARRDYPNQRVTTYLNQLLTRAHSYIYQEDVSDLSRVGRYFTDTVPQAFRHAARYTLVAFLLFALPAIITFRLAYADPEIAGVLGLEDQRQALANQTTWTDIPIKERPYTSTFIMSNNIRVALLAFGGGMAFGLFAVYILAINGVLLGAIFGLAVHYGMGQVLLDFVIAHGIVELSVIFIAGGAGLQIGHALINPGRHSRRDAVSLAAQRAVPLAVIPIPLLICAGLVEGFVSPSNTPFALKALVGVGIAALVYGYLIGGYRGNKGLAVFSGSVE